MEDYFIIQEKGSFLILQLLRVHTPNDNWFIEARYCDEKDSYAEALSYIEDLIGGIE